jgi:hypothetical protein
MNHYVSLSVINSVFRPPVLFLLPPHCTKDVYISQGSTSDLWTVQWSDSFQFWFQVIVNVRKLPYLIPRTFHTVRLNLIRFEQCIFVQQCNFNVTDLHKKDVCFIKVRVSSDTSERNYPCPLPEETTWLVTKCDKIFLTGFNCHSTKPIKSTHLSGAGNDVPVHIYTLHTV